MKKIVYSVLVLLFTSVVFFYFHSTEIKHVPGILVNEIPKQNKVNQRKTWVRNGYFFKALAEFEIEARVLGKKCYSNDEESKISPCDLALGWGQMSDTAVLENIEITQDLRFYFWKTDSYPIPREDIERKSANMHIIPANEIVEGKLYNVVKGNVIQFSGYLVEVRGENNFYWKSSLNRMDTGNGACEVVWVENIVVII